MYVRQSEQFGIGLFKVSAELCKGLRHLPAISPATLTWELLPVILCHLTAHWTRIQTEDSLYDLVKQLALCKSPAHKAQ